MIKQEAIQKAYGELWEKAKNYVDQNGYIPLGLGIIDISNLKNYQLKTLNHFCWPKEHGEWCTCGRPLTLKGLETNNDWISVTENDLLPKPGTNVFIVKDGEISKRVWIVDYLDRLISETSFSTETILKTQITHYKILEFPTEKPVY